MNALATNQAGGIAKVIYKDEKLKGNVTADLFVGQSEKDFHMKTTLQKLKKWIRLAESEHLEFKQAGRQFDSEKLTRYCVALANEGGGKLILGVTDKPPRQIAGTEAFPDVGKTQAQLLDRLHLRIDMEEMVHPDGRIVIVHIPSRPIALR